MLVISLPAKPDYLRVKFRRRFQRIGAVSIKGAVYLLPDTPARLADFQVLRQEVLADGGDGAIWSSVGLVGTDDTELIKEVRGERDAEYAEFGVAAQDLAARWGMAIHAGIPSAFGPLRAERERLFARLEEILKRDDFLADGRESAMLTLEQLAILEAPSLRAATPK